ncbi:MAG: alkaline phosphatase family protein [Micrococcaceae bacterium]
MTELLEPYYGKNSLKNVFSSALAVLGEESFSNELKLPAAQHIIVLLIDGLGMHQLEQLRGHTPFFRTQQIRQIRAGFPSTTACSLASLGTSLVPGQHGLIGYQVFDPASQKVIGMLGNWDQAILDQQQWQPFPSVFEQTKVKTFSIGSKKYEDSDLTHAILGGSDYRAAESLEEILEISLEISSIDEPTLSYAYWNKIDHLGHSKGWQSHEYADELEKLDALLQTAVAQLPEDTALIVTADHGMIDVTMQDQLILNSYPEIMDIVTAISGEPRVCYLHTQQEEKLYELCQELFGEYAQVLKRDEAIQNGYFGTVRQDVYHRIANVILVGKHNFVFFDIDGWGPGPLNMIGQHGSLTEAEQNIPLMIFKGE